MAIWEDLAKGGAQGLMSGIGEMAKDFRQAFTGDISAEDKAKLQQKAMDLELAASNAQMQMIMTEASSKDPWTSRARPTFMYVFYFILIAVGIFAPFVGVFFPAEMTTFFANIKLGFNAIPDSLYTLFGVGYTGYAGARMMEKKWGVSK